MKLLMCFKCQSIFNLTRDEKHCDCKKSSGKYLTDGIHSVISGPCILIGFANSSFSMACKIQQIENRAYDPKTHPDTCCEGQRFTAFFIPDWAKTIKRTKP